MRDTKIHEIRSKQMCPSLPQEIIDKILHHLLEDAYYNYFDDNWDDDGDHPLCVDYFYCSPFTSFLDEGGPIYCHAGRDYALLVRKLAAISTATLVTCNETFRQKIKDLLETQYRMCRAEREYCYHDEHANRKGRCDRSFSVGMGVAERLWVSPRDHIEAC